MTFLPEYVADNVFQISLCIIWIHNDSMYVRFGGIRNTKTWSKSRLLWIFYLTFWIYSGFCLSQSCKMSAIYFCLWQTSSYTHFEKYMKY